MPVPRLAAHPLALALVLTLSNAVKPVVIDDTAYLSFARHLSDHPLDPYGFNLFWYEKPEPAMEIILPPVVPYWLAVGLSLFGEQLFLIKLWLFPFAALLAYAARYLVRRFVSMDSPHAVMLLVIGPGILPLFNFMLDIPAIALQSAAVALCVRGTDPRRKWGSLALAGVCLGLALQTKYAVLGLPAVLFAIASLRRAWVSGLVPLAVGLTLFAGWELYLVSQYGQSHFLYHLTRKGGESAGLLDFLGNKAPLIQPLLAFLGLTAGWVGLLGLARVVSPRTLRLIAGVLAALVLVIVFVPGRWTVLIPSPDPARNPLTLADVYFRVVGGLAVVVGIRFTVVTAFRGWSRSLRPAWESKFLLAWLVIELGAYFAISPFPAGRRVLGVSFVGTLIALRVWVRLSCVETRVRAASWVLQLGLATGIGAAAIDCWDALPERELPRLAAQTARDHGWAGQGYFVGHWGFQFYADREGMRIVEPGKTRLRAGDWLVLPLNPDGRTFFRPHDGGGGIILDGRAVTPEVALVWNDYLAAQTIPNLYAGRTPVLSRTHPRMAVTVYRVTTDWTPAPAPE